MTSEQSPLRGNDHAPPLSHFRDHDVESPLDSHRVVVDRETGELSPDRRDVTIVSALLVRDGDPKIDARPLLLRQDMLLTAAVFAAALVMTTGQSAVEVTLENARINPVAVRLCGWVAVGLVMGGVLLVVRPRRPAPASWRHAVVCALLVAISEGIDALSTRAALSSSDGAHRPHPWVQWMRHRHWAASAGIVGVVVVAGTLRWLGNRRRSGRATPASMVAIAAAVVTALAAAAVLWAAWPSSPLHWLDRRWWTSTGVAVVGDGIHAAATAVALVLAARLMGADAHWRPPALLALVAAPTAALLCVLALVTRDGDRLYHAVRDTPLWQPGAQLVAASVVAVASVTVQCLAVAAVRPLTMAVAVVAQWAAVAGIGELAAAERRPTISGSWIAISGTTLLVGAVVVYAVAATVDWYGRTMAVPLGSQYAPRPPPWRDWSFGSGIGRNLRRVDTAATTRRRVLALPDSDSDHELAPVTSTSTPVE